MNVIFYQEWWDLIKNLKNSTSRLEMLEAIGTYGIDGAEPQFTDENMKVFFTSAIRPKLDENRAKYQEKVLFGENTGRRKVVDDKEIFDLASAGFSAKDIAARLGISVDSVYHSKGWVNRTKISKPKSKSSKKNAEEGTVATIVEDEFPSERAILAGWNF